MRHHDRSLARWLRSAAGIALLFAVCLQLAACGAAGDDKLAPRPARVVPIVGTDLNQVILSAEAVRRLGIATAPLRLEQVRGARRTVVPYPALLYAVAGTPWVYTNPAPLTYVRARVAVDFIDGGRVVLTSGPPVGTLIVTLGASELYGAEFGVGDEA
jgi:hypothetical protein